MITTNMEIAKSIWRDQLRLMRIPLLQQLDIEYIRALENNDLIKQQDIINKKQILRDAPKDLRIDDAITTEQLLTINPIKELEN